MVIAVIVITVVAVIWIFKRMVFVTIRVINVFFGDIVISYSEVAVIIIVSLVLSENMSVWIIKVGFLWWICLILILVLIVIIVRFIWSVCTFFAINNSVNFFYFWCYLGLIIFTHLFLKIFSFCLSILIICTDKS